MEQRVRSPSNNLPVKRVTVKPQNSKPEKMKYTVISGVSAALIVASMAGCTSPKNTTASQPRDGGAPSTEEIFVQMDADKDGRLAKSEVRGPVATDFAKIDTNGDGYISKEELAKAPKPGRRPQRRGGPGRG